jgi:L-ascorbate metabolism protein UlaG (beta-lactamase superfamily)
MRPEDILVPTPSGVCCKPGGFHIDPTRPVERALITHGHSDHARSGHGHVLATQETLDIMRLRYGENFAGSTQVIGYGEPIRIKDVDVSFHPAGHVLGSAQIKLTRKNMTSSRRATTRMWRTRPARRSNWCRAMCSSPRRRSDYRCFAMAIRSVKSANC